MQCLNSIWKNAGCIENGTAYPGRSFFQCNNTWNLRFVEQQTYYNSVIEQLL